MQLSRMATAVFGEGDGNTFHIRANPGAENSVANYQDAFTMGHFISKYFDDDKQDNTEGYNYDGVTRKDGTYTLNYGFTGKSEAGYAFGPFVRTSYVLHMVIRGKGALRKEGKAYQVHAGEAFLIYPKEETIYQADPHDPWEYLWIGFHGFQAEEMMARAGFSRQNPVVHCKNMQQMQQVMERMLSNIGLSYVKELERMSALYSLLALLVVNGEENGLSTAEGGMTPDSLYVRTAVNMLLNSYHKDIKVAEVAKAIGISRNYLTSIFKKEMNVSPQEFLINFRMEKAGSLLRNTNEPVGTIAAEVGYTDSLSFSKAFRKKYGKSPSEYRREKL